MSNLYCSITQEEANLLGEFEYETNKRFSPFVGKQTNGNYIVSKEMYETLKDADQFKKVDWSGKLWVTPDEFDFEKINLK